MPFTKGHKINVGREKSPETREKLRIANIGKKASKKARRNMSIANNRIIQIGKENRNWKGGKTHNAKGYIFIFNNTHPLSSKYRNQMPEHRLVVENQIKRFLISSEEVHHLNEIPHDNRPENLMAFISKSAHQRFHNNPANIKPEEIIFDGRLLH